MGDIKKISWRELKAFCNEVDEKYLDEDVCISNGESTERVIAELTTGNIYYNKHDNEDVWDKKEFESELEIGNIDKPEDYILQPIGIPYLTTEF